MKGKVKIVGSNLNQSGRIVQWAAVVYGVLWTFLQVLTLEKFPYVHSDEAWISGLSLTMLRERSVLVTETFFDTFPRQEHVLKILYHALQAAFIHLFGFQISSVRLISLVAAAACLVLLYFHAVHFLSDRRAALFLTILFSVQIQFLYAAHLARQEILLLLVLVLAAFLYDRTTAARFWIIPLLIGLSATLHPNAFIVAVMVGLVLIKDVMAKQLPHIRFMQYVGILSLCAIVLILISLAMTPDFLSNYARYGTTFGMDAGPAGRWQNFIAYFIKLFQQISGSYWLPDIRFWLIIGGLATLVSLLLLLFAGQRLEIRSRRGLENGVCLMGGFLMATFIVGRYNPTAILFAFYPLFVLVGHLLNALWCSRSKWLKGTALAAAAALVMLSLVNSIQTMRPFVVSATDPYESYLAEIREHLPEDAVVLGNLSAGFALMDIPFYDIRNLDHLGNADTLQNSGSNEAFIDEAARTTAADVEAYLKKNRINTVIWYEEYDYIIRNPMWRILYEEESDSQTPSAMLTSLKQVLETEGSLLYTFESAVYGTRIARFMDDYPWQIQIYRLSHDH